MYNELFNKELQDQMTSYFTNDLSVKGRVKAFEKNEIIDPDEANYVYIVLDGDLNQIIYSQDGKELTFFRLERGNIFGEMDFFEGFRTCVVTKTLTACALSIVSREVVEEELLKRPELYQHYMHSIIRKYRIVMLEFADIRFNDSIGKIAHTLLRLSHTTSMVDTIDHEERIINLSFTHEELATRINSNRSTITNGLNRLKDEGIIKCSGKQITIADYNRLKQYINLYIPE